MKKEDLELKKFELERQKILLEYSKHSEYTSIGLLIAFAGIYYALVPTVIINLKGLSYWIVFGSFMFLFGLIGRRFLRYRFESRDIKKRISKLGDSECR